MNCHRSCGEVSWHWCYPVRDTGRKAPPCRWKRCGRQVTWIPCEIQPLSLAVAAKHFSPYIIQSRHNVCILTDSKPCVEAFEKLCRGEFSASPRVSTYVYCVSRYQATVRHLAGSANVPSDFASRNAATCDDGLMV